MDNHVPELYADSQQPAKYVSGFDAISEEQVVFFQQQGYIAVEGAFDPEAVEAAKDGLADLIMGRIPDFTSIEFEAAAQASLDTLSLDQRQDAVRKLMYFTPFEKRLREIAESPALRRVVKRLLGYEPELFQDMALIKPPLIGREKPWHQDKAYFNLPQGTPVVGVWIALDEATLENGCMRILPGGHYAGPITHFARRDWQICDSEMLGRRCVAVPLKPGGCLLFDGLLPHGTPRNSSPARRRAIQYHYKPAATPITTDEERMAVFGSEGKNVSC